ncbi:Uncharacterized protein GBIM_13095 [Gryllus bimaculatus]|nr:Uncharacterized protein GBIM_13095 [Gryllus bimaculatus]
MGAWADTLRVFAATLLVIELARAAPAVKDDVIYDQRQNGTENYRLHIDGVVIAVAPAEMLLNLADLVDFSSFGGTSGGGGGSDGGGGGGDFVEGDLTPPKPEESSSAMETTTGAAATESSATEGGAAAAQDTPDKDPSEPAAADAPTTPKPAKKIK